MTVVFKHVQMRKEITCYPPSKQHLAVPREGFKATALQVWNHLNLIGNLKQSFLSLYFLGETWVVNSGLDKKEPHVGTGDKMFVYCNKLDFFTVTTWRAVFCLILMP